MKTSEAVRNLVLNLSVLLVLFTWMFIIHLLFHYLLNYNLGRNLNSWNTPNNVLDILRYYDNFACSIES